MAASEIQPPYGPLLLILEDGALWLTTDYYAGDRSAETMTFARTDLAGLQRRYPRLAMALTTTRSENAPRILREP